MVKKVDNFKEKSNLEHKSVSKISVMMIYGAMAQW